jgi:hypothetical protein
MEIEGGGAMDLAGEWTLRYQPQQLAGEKREQHLKQQYLHRHPAPAPDLLAKLHEGVKISAPCDVHTGTFLHLLIGGPSSALLHLSWRVIPAAI